MKYLSTIRSFPSNQRRPKSKRNSSSSEKNLSDESLVEGKYHPLPRNLNKNPRHRSTASNRRLCKAHFGSSYRFSNTEKTKKKHNRPGVDEVRRMRKKKKKGGRWIKRSWWRVWGGKGCKQRIKRGTDGEGEAGLPYAPRLSLWRKRTMEGNDDRYASLRTLRAEQPTTASYPLSVYFYPLSLFFFFLSFSLPPLFPSSCVRVYSERIEKKRKKGKRKKCNWNATSLDRYGSLTL